MTEPTELIQLRGDVLARNARRWLLAALIALALTLPCIIFKGWVWRQLVQLGSASFMLVAAAWGLIIAIGPIVFVGCGLTGLFLRVEASFAPRVQHKRLKNRIVIGPAVILSFCPALAALYPPINGLMTGLMGFRGLGQQYPQIGDPYGFWQAVTFWVMGSATLAFLASVYWWAKWKTSRSITRSK